MKKIIFSFLLIAAMVSSCKKDDSCGYQDVTGTAASSEQLSDLFSAVDLHQQQERDYSISMLPDVKETLSALRKSGLKLSVYSSDRQANLERILADLGVLSYFDVVLGGDSVKQAKPDPEGFLAACAAVGVPPEATVYVTDTIEDVQMARRGRAREVVGVETGLAARHEFEAVGCRVIKVLGEFGSSGMPRSGQPLAMEVR